MHHWMQFLQILFYSSWQSCVVRSLKDVENNWKISTKRNHSSDASKNHGERESREWSKRDARAIRVQYLPHWWVQKHSTSSRSIFPSFFSVTVNAIVQYLGVIAWWSFRFTHLGVLNWLEIISDISVSALKAKKGV